MIRAALIPAGVLAFCSVGLATATADPGPAPAQDSAVAYLIGSCYDPSQPVVEQPQTLVYGCDHTSVMVDMTWTSWDAEGARGTGIDDAVECQPNCAEGPRITYPIVVHAWNPRPASAEGCPAGVQFYRDYTVAYPEGAPPWVQPGTSWTEDVDYFWLDGVPAVHFKNQEPLSCTPLS
ncbi:hypothetical protein [[Mycobacterium] burgundiense]|uniref:Secreted protein n=1 Tax=[Mycobacterium] burgundiense TaxID=3064286 RepID=A0ABN9NAU8_9MYCO|nr:hypothetical protein [Mycolicibacterium sp. MU0053]CAJ1503322.1 hypothetical protein MU0053_002407 [Mycolicibacterium sp. MU0053]